MFVILLLARTLVVTKPVIAALWGMVAVACCYEWRRYLSMVRGARLAPEAWQWLVIEQGQPEFIQSIRYQELVIRRYSCHP